MTSDDARGTTVELHLDVEWGSPIAATGRTVQRRVAAYLERMTGARPAAVDVVVDAIGPPQ